MFYKLLLSALILNLLLVSGSCQQNIPSVPFIGDFFDSLLRISPSELRDALANLTLGKGSPTDVKFLVYQPEPNANSTKWKIVGGVNATRPTVIYVQGWFASPTSKIVTKLAEEYKKKDDNYNIITVDWRTFSKQNYLDAAYRTKTAGHAIGDLISKAVGKDLHLLKNFHVVGHSLGAHVAGFAGKRVTEKTGEMVKRITGLDPAGPLFEIPVTLPESERLSRNDAEDVQAIHTNVRLLGFSGQLGDADFYVALGGPIQPDCQTFEVDKAIYCSHMRALQYFLHSINNKKFMSVPCPNAYSYQTKKCNGNSRMEMGENTPATARGNYFVEPSSDSSFPEIDDDFLEGQT